jgi:uncharacterized membrane protein
MKKRIVFSVVCFILVAFCLTAMITTPLKYAECIYNNQDIVGTLDTNEAVTKTESSLLFKMDNTPSDYMTIRLIREFSGPIYIKVYLYNDDVENSIDHYNLTVPASQKVVSVDLSNKQYKNLEVVVAQGIATIETMDFHTQKPQIIESNIYPSLARILVAIMVSICAGILAFVLDLKFKFLDRDWKIKERAKGAAKVLVWFASVSAVSVIIELIISLVYRKISSSDLLFNYSRFVFIDAILLLICIFITNRKNIKAKVDRIVFAILLIMGMTMILILPPKHSSWDIDSHYQWALNASSLGKTYISQADLDFYYVYSESVPRKVRELNLADQERLNNENKYVVDIDYGQLSIAHFPAGIGIAVTRFFRLPFNVVYKSGEIATLLAYSLLCYFALRKIKSGKMILAVIALLPTNIFLASSYSYDYWVTGFSLLGMAYFIGNCQDKDGYISTKDTIIMVAAFALACIPKQVYIMFMLIPFFMPREKIRNKKKYYALCASGFVFLLLSFGIRSMNSIGGEGDTRGGDVNPSAQLHNILSNIPNYIALMIDFLEGYFSIGTTDEYMTCFAYLGTAKYGAELATILLITVTATDKDICDQYHIKWPVKSYLLLTFLATSVLMASALYISFTPVGSDVINGCQARYMTPLLYPLLATIGSGKLINKMNRSVYNYVILGIMSVIVMYGIYDTMLFRMI